MQKSILITLFIWPPCPLKFITEVVIKPNHPVVNPSYCDVHIIQWYVAKCYYCLFLESAGSASVAFHLLSPGSRPFYSQAILQSAAATNPWAMVTKQEAKLRARRLAEVLNCPYEDVSFI